MTTERKKRVDGLEFWNAVEKTDPKHTKLVSFGARQFTSIDAMYQIRCATEQWGPVGGRWWWEVEHSIIDGMFLARVQLFTPLGGRPIIQYGCAQLTGGKKPDHDAPKKAVTDGLTKCLSYVGFNADVFLGRFDDTKYVQQRNTEERERERPQATPAQLEQIQSLAAEIYGDGAAQHVAHQIRKRNVQSFEVLPAEIAVRWIGYLETQQEIRAQAPNPLPLTTEDTKEAPDA